MKIHKASILGLGIFCYAGVVLLFLFPHIFPFHSSGRIPSRNLIIFCQNTKCSQGFTLEETGSFWHLQKINIMKDASPQLLTDFAKTILQLEEKNPHGLYRLIPSYGSYDDVLEDFRLHKKLNKEDSNLIHVDGQWRIEGGNYAIGPTINYGKNVSFGIPQLPKLNVEDLEFEDFNKFRKSIETQNLHEYFLFSSWKVPKLIILTFLLMLFLLLVRINRKIILCWGILFVYVSFSWGILFFQ